MNATRLDLLGEEDIPAALELSSAEGWNQSAADWRRMIQLEPAGCLAAREDGRLIGTVTTTTYGRELAWIGMMLVLPERRGRGIGKALMRAALNHLQGLGIATVKLDATPQGLPLYASLGFAVESELERWQGVARPVAGGYLDGLPRATLPSLLAIDRAAYGIDRSRLVERLVADAAGEPLMVPFKPAEPGGYALARRGRMASYIGPVIAATPAAALGLLDGWIERLAGEEVSLDFHRSGQLTADAIAARGLTKRRILTRMRHGVHHEAGTARTICASSGPEFG